MRLLSFDRQSLKNTAKMEAILRLDRENMEVIFSAIGCSMPEERRKQAFNHSGTILMVTDDAGALLGYLEYGPGWDNPHEIYLSSIQVSKPHQNGSVFRVLLRHALCSDAIPQQQVIRTHVQSSNRKAILLYERLGFRVDTASEQNGTIVATLIGPPRIKQFHL
jgi:ribosomal protein S18 acetylase RimI-like enzyme